MNLRTIRRRTYANAYRGRSFTQPRCPDDYPGCPVCDLWHFFDNHGRFPRETEDFRREPTDEIQL